MIKNLNNLGTVYLLCFSEHYKHAKHYIGFTKDVNKRLSRHRKGQGARLIEVVYQAGIEANLARTWENVDRHFERKLKKQKNSKRLCPICEGKKALKKGLTFKK